MRVLVDSWASMIQSYLDLRVLEFFVRQVTRASICEFCKAWPIPVAGQTFCARFFHGILELHVIWIDVIDSSEVTSTFELRIFNRPKRFFCGSFSTSLTKLLAIKLIVPGCCLNFG